ncbi:MAG: PAS domain S-box protein [Candidatus Cloacimonetes bacterium]|nr:PAS domain S-box protein [Candidatus Cloacimonadota bacterium]
MNIQEKEDLIKKVFEHLIDSDTFNIKNEFSCQLIEFMSVLSENNIWLLDKHFNFTYVSKNIEELTGLSPEEFRRNGVRKNVTPTGLQLVVQIKHIIQSGELSSHNQLLKIDVEQIKKDKGRVWTEVTFHPFYKDFKYIGTIGFTRNIESRKKSEIELVKNRNRYLTFFESSPVCLWECDLSLLKVYLNSLRPLIIDNFESYMKDNPEEIHYCFSLITIQEANHTTLSTYITENQKDFSNWISKPCQTDSEALSLNLLHAIYKNKLSFEAEGIHYKKNNEAMNVNLKWNVVPGYEDLYKKVIFSVTDITNQKKAEQAILKTQSKLKKINKKLKSSIENEKMLAYEATIANNAKNRFLSTMSHEIRTPINGILGIAQLLQTTGLNQEQNEYADIILKSTNHLVNIVDNIFEYSKVISDQIQLSSGLFSLYETILNCTKSVAYYAHQKGLRLYFKWNYASPNMVEGDVNRIRQIFLYILDNAIKFTEKGSVTIVLHQAVKHEDNTYHFNFSVQDTGIGFEDKYADKIFEPFYQIDNMAHRKYSGTGLGLALVQQLIHISHGSIVPSSKPDKGTQFHITLPFKVSDNSPLLELNQNLQLKILVFEYDDKQIEIIDSFFDKSNVSCIFMSPDRVEDYFDFAKDNDSKFDFIIIRYSQSFKTLDILNNHSHTISLKKIKIILLYRISDQINIQLTAGLPIYAKVSLPIDMMEIYQLITL